MIRVVRLMLCLTLPLVVIGCHSENRYELSKDGAGRTIRLDKQTGDLAIVDGDHVTPLKDAAQVAALNASKQAALEQLEKLKQWDKTDIPTLGSRIFFYTSWRHGKMSYLLRIYSLSELKTWEAWDSTKGKLPNFDRKKLEDDLKSVMAHRPLSIQLDDVNSFRIQSIDVLPLTTVTDNEGKADHFEVTDSVPMTDDDYRRIARWNLAYH